MNLKFYLIAPIFCMSLLLDTNAIYFKSRANFREIMPCAMTGGNIFARNRIWERPCKTRRVSKHNDLSDFGSRERGPPHTDLYNPTYGYEPYWEFGDWVFEKIKSKENVPEMCGARCPIMYIEYGQICGVNKDFQYESFNTYCDMKNQDCDGYKGYKAIYRGKCVPGLITYPTESSYVVDKVDSMIKNYYARTPPSTINLKAWHKP